MNLTAPLFVQLTAALLFIVSIIGIFVGLNALSGEEMFAEAKADEDSELELLAEFPGWVSKLTLMVSFFTLAAASLGFWAARDSSNRRKSLTTYSMCLMLLCVVSLLPIMVYFGFTMRSENAVMTDLENVAIQFASKYKGAWSGLQDENKCCGFSMYWSVLMDTYHQHNGIKHADAPALWTGEMCNVEEKNFTRYAIMSTEIVTEALRLDGYTPDSSSLLSSVRISRGTFFTAVQSLGFDDELTRDFYDRKGEDEYFCEHFIVDEVEELVGGGIILAICCFAALSLSLWATLRILITTQGYGTVKESEIESLVDDEESGKGSRGGPEISSKNVEIQMT